MKSLWVIAFSETARKQFSKIDNIQQKRIMDFLRNNLSETEDPRSFSKALKGTLADFWRYRIGDYRLLAEMQNDQLRIHIVRIAHRKIAYKRK
jgi:mRNA interferase RelE/StbE